MGLFSFLKNAGSKIFNRDESDNTAELKASHETALRNVIHSMNLNIENLEVDYAGGTVTISGVADTPADKEKAILAVGNVDGVEAVDDRISVDSTEPAAQFYEVKSGDSLSKIAKQVYGDPMKYPLIFEANKPMLSDPDKIYPGQQLRIPAIQ